ncbi:hypothetical protein FA13DRAFT_1732337 [Coprinellus micaceus]|uniref:Uncharacterized protein n=1 Tax=Coprinellus micaceus TaxID=71717 RepID=A0A4Y7TC29_COPMI|nr:hypothetical protein FA13DRAFT_1732337 [Coprinellus micaceus]
MGSQTDYASHRRLGTSANPALPVGCLDRRWYVSRCTFRFDHLKLWFSMCIIPVINHRGAEEEGAEMSHGR